MYSTEKLISEVQNYPCIWDMGSNEYMNRELKNSSWLKVAEAVYHHDWDNFSAIEKEEKVKELKNKKWKHVRDAYLKYTSDEKNIRSGSEAIKKKPYAYAEVMSFLNTTTKKRKTTDNFEPEENATYNSSDDMEDDIPETVVTSTPMSKNRAQKRSRNKITPFQSNLLEQLKKSQETTSNPDLNIVMSFLPYVKLLNDEQKLDFQINGLQYLKQTIKRQNPPPTFNQQNVLSEPRPQYQTPIAPFHLNNYSMAQNSPSNLCYISNSNTQSHPYPTYTQISYPQSLSFSNSEIFIHNQLPPVSQHSPPNQTHN